MRILSVVVLSALVFHSSPAIEAQNAPAAPRVELRGVPTLVTSGRSGQQQPCRMGARGWPPVPLRHDVICGTTETRVGTRSDGLRLPAAGDARAVARWRRLDGSHRAGCRRHLVRLLPQRDSRRDVPRQQQGGPAHRRSAVNRSEAPRGNIWASCSRRHRAPTTARPKTATSWAALAISPCSSIAESQDLYFLYSLYLRSPHAAGNRRGAHGVGGPRRSRRHDHDLAQRRVVAGDVHRHWRQQRWIYPAASPVFPTPESWHDEDTLVDAFWGPSVHWNTHVERYVMLLNRAKDVDYGQEGIYVSFAPSLEQPTPGRARENSQRRELVPTGPRAGQRARHRQRRPANGRGFS